MKPTSFINSPSQDIYYICQMVDRSLEDMEFLRHIDSFMGDMACVVLLGEYPKFTPLHEYIETLVLNVIFEEVDMEEDILLNEARSLWGQKLWVDHLLKAHNFEMSFLKWAEIDRDEKRPIII